MSSIQIKSNITLENLIQGVAQLEEKDLDDFIKKILSIRARRQLSNTNLNERESELIELISSGPHPEVWTQFQELNQKREEGILNEKEHAELIKITTEMEAQNVQRIKYLSELALLKETDLRTLMNQLGIAPAHG